MKTPERVFFSLNKIYEYKLCLGLDQKKADDLSDHKTEEVTNQESGLLIWSVYLNNTFCLGYTFNMNQSCCSERYSGQKQKHQQEN